MNTHWVACYTKKEVTYFDSFGVANILKKILKIIAVFFPYENHCECQKKLASRS